MSLISWFQLFQLHFIIISNIIPTALKIHREERLDHLNYRENSIRFCLCCCVNNSSMDLVEISGFGCRLNYASFNVRFNLLKNDFTRHHHLSLLFDIIITITVVVLVIVILISKIIIIINAIGVNPLSYPLLVTVPRQTHSPIRVVSHE